MRRLLVVLIGIVSLGAASLLPASAAQRVIWIGGTDPGGTLQDWQAGNSAIGPWQTDNLYYPPGKPLPSSYGASICAQLPSNVVCDVTWKSADNSTNNLQAFVRSIPANRATPVIMTFYHEPEDNFSDPATFISEFESESTAIRSDCAAQGNCAAVQIAMTANTFQYSQSVNPDAYNCGYIPPPSYVDHYFADVYEPDLGGLKNNAAFQRWVACTNGLHHNRGIAEYGLGTCVSSGTWTEQEREQALAADAAYLASTFPGFQYWSYYWATGSGCDNWRFPAGSATAKEWQAIETGTVPS